MSDGGKGDKQRPGSVPLEKFDSNWDLIFSKKKRHQDEFSDEMDRQLSMGAEKFAEENFDTLIIGEYVPPMTLEKWIEFGKALSEYET